MRLATIGEGGSRVGVACSDGSIADASGAIHDLLGPDKVDMRAVIVHFGELEPTFCELAAAGGRLSPEEINFSPPVLDPSKIVAAPVNYRDHMEEMYQASHIDSLGVFLKAPSSLVAHKGVVKLPYHDRRFDQECELCLVIAKVTRNVPVAEALDCVFGYSVLLDITMRGGEDRSTRKSFDTFTPMGPWLVTPDEVGQVDELELRCWVNGELRQEASIADLIWAVPELISYVSSVMTLFPGDVITTGTPKGVGPIDDSDRIVAEVSRVGSLAVTVSAKGATKSATRGASTGALGAEGEKKR